MSKSIRAFQKKAEKWRSRLWLNDWLLDVELVDELEDDYMQEAGQFGVAVRAGVMNRYKHAQFTVTDIWFKHSPRDRDKMALHEMLHVVLGPISSYVANLINELPASKQDMALSWWHEAHEEVTTKLENVMWYAYDEDKLYKEKKR